MTISALGQRALRAIGVQVTPSGPGTSFAVQRQCILTNLSIQVAIDVGANVGNYGEELRSYGFKHQIRSVEPGSAAFGVLEKKVRRDRQWTASKSAVSDREGTADLFVTNNLSSSSIYRPISGGPLDVLGVHATSTETVPLTTLQRLIGLWGDSGPQFLKIDIQGEELNALMGLGSAVDKILLVEMEVQLVDMYQNAPNGRAAVRYLMRHQFHPVAIQSNLLDPNTYFTQEYNVLFARK